MAASNIAPMFVDMKRKFLGLYGDYKVPQLNVSTSYSLSELICERKATSMSTMPNYGNYVSFALLSLFVCICVVSM